MKEYGSLSTAVIEHEQQCKTENNNNTTTTTTTTANDGIHETLKTLAGVAGNVLEWFDFAVFGFFSDILSQVFFPPHQQGNAALIESFAVFGGAFAMRPIGGILMGYIGDVHGRKFALEVSIFLMAFPTFCMGLLPTYEQVGSLSYILLILIRLLQGLSVGGQLMSSLVFTLEGRPKEHWGLYGSYVMATANFGTLLGGVVGYTIRTLLNDEQVLAYGWRIPFLSGILVSLCGFYLKFYCQEDESFHGHNQTHCGDAAVAGGGGNVLLKEVVAPPKNPIKIAFQRKNLRQLAAACFIPMLWSGGFYLTFVWMAIFMADLIPSTPFSTKEAFGVNSIALFVSVCVLFPFAGILSDIFGRRRIMTIGGIIFGLGAPLAVMGIAHGNNIVVALFCQSCLGICLSLWGAPMMAWLVENFEPEARLTSAAVGYNIGQAAVGGLTPALATLMVDKYGYSSPGVLLTVLAIIALFGLWVIAPATPPITETKTKATSTSSWNNEEKYLLLMHSETCETESLDSSSNSGF